MPHSMTSANEATSETPAIPDGPSEDSIFDDASDDSGPLEDSDPLDDSIFDIDGEKVYVKDIWTFLESPYAEAVAPDKEKKQWANIKDITQRADIFVALMYNFSRRWDRICPRCMRWGYADSSNYIPVDHWRWERSGTCSTECEMKLSAYLSFKAMQMGRTLEEIMYRTLDLAKKTLIEECIEIWKLETETKKGSKKGTKKVEIPSRAIKEGCKNHIKELESNILDTPQLRVYVRSQLESRDYVAFDFDRMLIKATACMILRESPKKSSGLPIIEPPSNNAGGSKLLTKKGRRRQKGLKQFPSVPVPTSLVENKLPNQVPMLQEFLLLPEPSKTQWAGFCFEFSYMLVDEACDQGIIPTDQVRWIATDTLRKFEDRFAPPRKPDTEHMDMMDEVNNIVYLNMLGRQGMVAGTVMGLEVLKVVAEEFFARVKSKTKHIRTQEQRFEECLTVIRELLVDEAIFRGSRLTDELEDVLNEVIDIAKADPGIRFRIVTILQPGNFCRQVLRAIKNNLLEDFLERLADRTNTPDFASNLIPRGDYQNEDVHRDRFALKELLAGNLVDSRFCKLVIGEKYDLMKEINRAFIFGRPNKPVSIIARAEGDAVKFTITTTKEGSEGSESSSSAAAKDTGEGDSEVEDADLRDAAIEIYREVVLEAKDADDEIEVLEVEDAEDLSSIYSDGSEEGEVVRRKR